MNKQSVEYYRKQKKKQKEDNPLELETYEGYTDLDDLWEEELNPTIEFHNKLEIDKMKKKITNLREDVKILQVGIFVLTVVVVFLGLLLGVLV